MDINLDTLDDMFNPDESGSEYDNSNSAEGLLGAAKTMGSIGALGAAGYAAKSAIPKGINRDFANHSMNFLEGFYKPGITSSGKIKLYAAEAAKASGRLISTSLNPREAVSYANTGVSRLVEQKIDSITMELDAIDRKYIDGEYGEALEFDNKGNVKKGHSAIKKAKAAKNKVIKERHYKVLNDAANREIFGGKESKILTDYRKRKPHLRNFWDHDVTGVGKNRKYGTGFLKSAGGLDKANYIASRHNIGHGELPGVGRFFTKQKLITSNPNLRYIKWLDNSISGVLRGAQFNFKTYEVLEAMKRNKMGQNQALSALRGLSEVKGSGIGSPTLFKDGKIMFNFSPSIKSNFDWGGYNAVAEWDYNHPTKVRFHATDLRDTPISSLMKGNNVLNYVESKEVNIATMKDHVDMETKPNYVKSDKIKAKKIVNPDKIPTRQEFVKSGGLNSGGQYKTMRTGMDKISDSKKTSRSRLKIGHYNKNMIKYLSKIGRIGSAAALAYTAYQLFSDKKD